MIVIIHDDGDDVDNDHFDDHDVCSYDSGPTAGKPQEAGPQDWESTKCSCEDLNASLNLNE